MIPQASFPPIRNLCPFPIAGSTRRADAGVAAVPWRRPVELGLLPSAVTRARREAREVLREWNVYVDNETAELLISELVTNSLKAASGGGQPVSLVLSASETLLTIKVWDGSPCAPTPGEWEAGVPPLDGENGRGLFLVSVLSAGWGWYPTSSPAGKVTWCQLQVPADSQRSGQPESRPGAQRKVAWKGH
ncbi:hypothetical protein FDG2_4078 [Candidatus Protofrankia californiensis]|uniref:Histidine kinase/HSP90-like ATPase domain-containing protein n=1 Tax=Candidatus Protofrankia californiensis TaxID=1839754 RepID=A0A1C3P358_9ACTN|nr:hypothetical protein FDG2_4078 [Candidatus Protofrankia californiensis]